MGADGYVTRGNTVYIAVEACIQQEAGFQHGQTCKRIVLQLLLSVKSLSSGNHFVILTLRRSCSNNLEKRHSAETDIERDDRRIWLLQYTL